MLWPQQQGQGTREEAATNSTHSPNLSWQTVMGKRKQPRTLRVTNQGGKGSGQGKPVLHGRGGGPNQALKSCECKGMGASSSRGVGLARRGIYEEFVKGKKGHKGDGKDAQEPYANGPDEAYGEEGEARTLG